MSIEALALPFMAVNEENGVHDPTVDGSDPAPNNGDDGKYENTVVLAGILDLSDTNWGLWGYHILNLTVQLLNEPNNGFHDDVAESGIHIDWVLGKSSECTIVDAIESFVDLFYRNGQEIHGIIGCGCSRSTMAVAPLAASEGIPLVSPTSTSQKMSDKEDFPLVSRLVGPDNADGQVGALVAAIKLFGWERVTVLATDTQYARDLADAFKGHLESENLSINWQGEVGHTALIPIEVNGDIDSDRFEETLKEVPVDEPTRNSRIILLVAHDNHAYQILKNSTELNFQPDTIWIGTDAWVGRYPADDDISWMADIPGYLGLDFFRNKNRDYQFFLERLQEWERSQGRSITTELPTFEAEATIDSIVTLAKALAKTPPHQRKDGSYVSKILRGLSFHGVSGPVSFTENGDRYDSRFTIYNMQETNAQSFQWEEVGSTLTGINSAQFNPERGTSKVCFPDFGCVSDLSTLPEDTYPVPVPPVEPDISQKITLPILASCFVGLVVFAYLWMRRRIRRAPPKTWDLKSKQTLNEVRREVDEFVDVERKLQRTMPNARITKLWRVQNKKLWNYYCLRKERLAKNHILANVKTVWHGTSNVDPSVIYNDLQDGFAVQFARSGLWG